jgi:hypothetical protein
MRSDATPSSRPLFADLEELVNDHRPHGPLLADATTPARNGYVSPPASGSPWLRINRALRAMLHERWSAEAWPQVKAEFTKALALRSEIRRAGWFNLARN